MLDIQTFVTLSTPSVRSLLEQIAASGVISRADLERKVPVAIAEKMDESLRSLKDAHLIDEKESPISDYNRLYVTTDGLQALRKFLLP